ncbi:hypothetical protein ACP70R_009373 [Stipagrostis hirtigluma subsp. patula]
MAETLEAPPTFLPTGAFRLHSTAADGDQRGSHLGPRTLAMASCGNPGAARDKDLRVLLPFSCDSLVREQRRRRDSGRAKGLILLRLQRVPDELAEEIGAAAKATVVGPFAKVWSVEVGRDRDGAFLGRGWPEFAAACGVGAGWFLVLRHRGHGLLTVKAFDASFCHRELGIPTPPAVEATRRSTGTAHKPNFISLLSPDSMTKMRIPAEFIQCYISKERLNNCMAIVISPLGKVCPIELEMHHLDMFFAGGWSQFLTLHGITKANALLLRYEGNMVFTVKVFDRDGCQIRSDYKEIRVQKTSSLSNVEKQREAPSTSIHKRKSKKDWPNGEGQKKPKGSMTSLNKTLLGRNSVYEIGPRPWIKKQINSNALENHLALPTAFCNAIGFSKRCTITLKTSMNGTRSWQVRGVPYNNGSYLLVKGWRTFCQENSLQEGDICTFNVIQTTMWHALDASSTSSNKGKSKNGWPSSDEIQKSPKGSKTSLRNSTKTHCVYDVGPPAWMRKKINSFVIKNHLSLPRPFCDAIGFQKPCVITLQASMYSTRSWQVHGLPYKNGSSQLGSGWKKFCRDIGLKEGDICTIKVIETTLWDVAITH